MTEDIVVIARDLKLPPEKVQHAVELLDAGNTIPFIARFRKDQTGGLDPEQVLAIKQRVSQLRALAERKSFVLKSIEQQGVLTEALAKEISQATSSRRVEDLYLPFKAKKQTLALTARQQGLEPLAQEILSGEKSESELAARALDFVRVDKGLASVVDVMSGVGHLIAEQYSERSDLRRELRRIIWATGSLCCKSTKSNEAANAGKSEATAGSQATTETESATAESADAANSLEHVASEATAAATEPEQHAEHLAAEIDATDVETTEVLAEDESGENAGEESQASEEGDTPETKPEATGTEPNAAAGSKPADKNQAKKTGKAKAPANPFADYEDFSESLRKIPNHRILAINRGERAGLLKAKVKAEQQQLEAKLFELLIPAEHPSRAFLIECARDAFSRMIFPSLEREIRRELTETAEQHALRVFSENLKALLLQPPVRGKRILAIDPGYKSGCAVSVLDEQGAVLHTDKLFVVGNQTRRTENRTKLASLVKQHHISLVAIGNGTACREAEQMVSDAIKQELAELQTRYVIVNEAGTSTYSTSEIGKEELPNVAAGARCAVSIGRRLLDPLSELVKISPANLGVGLYQHDIKAKHLAESLEEVVDACVNHVGVNINTASVALLRHIAGLNQLTARRLLEHRTEKPFTNRQQLREVSGIGDATFVQAAGFLRIFGGDQPLDETAIHPESYPLAERILAKVGWTVADWANWRQTQESRNQQTPPAATTSQEVPVAAPSDSSAEPAATESAAPTPAAELVNRDESGREESRREETRGPGPRPPHPLNKLSAAELASEFGTGELLVKDILEALQRPTSDPRNKNLGPVFRSGIIKLEDLQPEMRLDSQIVNVVDFGVFVDVGLGYSCLVHVSELSRGFVRDLHQQFAVGDVLTTWVKEIDAPRRRVKLTAIPPGAKKFERRRRQGGGESAEAGGEQRQRPPRGERPAGGNRPPRPDRGGPDRGGPDRGAPGRGGPDRSGAERGAGRGGSDRGPRGDRQQGVDRSQRQPRGQRPGSRPSQPVAAASNTPPAKMPRRPSPGKFERRQIERPSKPKPVKPISEDMLTGDKPMRSFSDLAQFFQKKKPGEDEAGE
jgi:uncharacterized protein